jgi:hypothetical protein
LILMLNLDRACRVQLAIQASGQTPRPVSPEVCERTARQYESGDSNRLPGQRPASSANGKACSTEPRAQQLPRLNRPIPVVPAHLTHKGNLAMKRREMIQLGAGGFGLTLAGIPLSCWPRTAKAACSMCWCSPNPGPDAGHGAKRAHPADRRQHLRRPAALRRKAQPQPLLATAGPSKDGLSYTFKLKPGVKWHDGKPFSSADVVFSVDVFLRKTRPAARQPRVPGVVRAVDAQTVEFKLKFPFGPFLGCSRPAPCP